MKRRLSFGAVGLWLLSACSAISVVTVPEPEPVAGGTFVIATRTVADHRWFGNEDISFHRGIKLDCDGTPITVGANNMNTTYLFAGAPYFPLFPVFWLHLFSSSDTAPLELDIVTQGQECRVAPHQVVVIQGGQELRPAVVRDKDGLLYLGYDTKSLGFAVELRDVRSPKGPVKLPRITFRRSWIWVVDMYYSD